MVFSDLMNPMGYRFFAEPFRFFFASAFGLYRSLNCAGVKVSPFFGSAFFISTLTMIISCPLFICIGLPSVSLRFSVAL